MSKRVRNIHRLKAFHGLFSSERVQKVVLKVVLKVVPGRGIRCREEESGVGGRERAWCVLPCTALYYPGPVPHPPTPPGYTTSTLADVAAPAGTPRWSVYRKNSLGSTLLPGLGSLLFWDTSSQGCHCSSEVLVWEERARKSGIGQRLDRTG